MGEWANELMGEWIGSGACTGVLPTATAGACAYRIALAVLRAYRIALAATVSALHQAG